MFGTLTILCSIVLLQITSVLPADAISENESTSKSDSENKSKTQ